MSQPHRESPTLPWKVRLLVSMFSFTMKAIRRPNGAINRRLMNLLDIKSSPSEKPINGVKTSDIIVDTTRNLWFRLYIPANTKNDGVTMPVIVYFHGGGFVFASADSKGCDASCRQLAKELNAVIASVNYRLAPEHRCPSQYEDGFDALKFIDENFENLPSNADPSRCFLAGESAGGNLAHHVAVKAGEYEFRNLKLIGLVAIQPFFGGEERTESETRPTGAPVLSLDLTDWFWKAFLPDGSDLNHPAVNVFGPNAVDISGVKFPATLLFIGGFDPLQDWQKRYYEGLNKCGKQVYLVEYPNAIHGFFGFETPESSLFIKEVRDFLQKQ